MTLIAETTGSEKEMSDVKYHYERNFLNEDEGIALCETRVTMDPMKSFPSISAHVVLSDCSRNITLEFGSYGDDDVDKSLYKIDDLLGQLKAFRKALAKASKEFKPIQKKHLEKQAEEKAKRKAQKQEAKQSALEAIHA